MATGIYIVDVPTEHNQHVRYVVLAGSATLARDLVGPVEPRADANAFDVGRLGDYDPGINGAGMVAPTSIIAIHRPYTGD